MSAVIFHHLRLWQLAPSEFDDSGLFPLAPPSVDEPIRILHFAGFAVLVQSPILDANLVHTFAGGNVGDIQHGRSEKHTWHESDVAGA